MTIDDAPWPGFPPDLTSIMTVVATQVEGTVLIHEKMFESRLAGALARLDPANLAGTVVGVHIVNVFGLINESRYLPDRRDLNRFFSGSAKGSLASRVAAAFMREIAMRSNV